MTHESFFRNESLGKFKPNIQETIERWEAYWEGDIIDRPIIRASFNMKGRNQTPEVTCFEKIHNDVETILKKALRRISETYYDEADDVPSFWPTFGPDEIAVFCGGSFSPKKPSDNTSWSVPFIENWEDSLPLKIDESHPMWKKMLDIYTKGIKFFNGSVLMMAPDWHTNIDLLFAARGADKLFIDLIDNPAVIDEAMQNSKTVFEKVWNNATEVGEMNKNGFYFEAFSKKSGCLLACDFMCMLGPDMFNRWILPALEFEASFGERNILHWDGPDALIHEKAILGIKNIHTISFVPKTYENHTQYIDFYKRVQNAGKGVVVSGTIEELKTIHKELNPAKTIYEANVNSKEEISDLVKWFNNNT